MALGSTQPLTEMSTRNLKKRNLGVKCATACNRDIFTFYLYLLPLVERDISCVIM
jgi:hypothetical protein